MISLEDFSDDTGDSPTPLKMPQDGGNCTRNENAGSGILLQSHARRTVGEKSRARLRGAGDSIDEMGHLTAN